MINHSLLFAFVFLTFTQTTLCIQKSTIGEDFVISLDVWKDRLKTEQMNDEKNKNEDILNLQEKKRNFQIESNRLIRIKEDIQEEQKYINNILLDLPSESRDVSSILEASKVLSLKFNKDCSFDNLELKNTIRLLNFTIELKKYVQNVTSIIKRNETSIIEKSKQQQQNPNEEKHENTENLLNSHTLIGLSSSFSETSQNECDKRLFLNYSLKKKHFCCSNILKNSSVCSNFTKFENLKNLSNLRTNNEIDAKIYKWNQILSYLDNLIALLKEREEILEILVKETQKKCEIRFDFVHRIINQTENINQKLNSDLITFQSKEKVQDSLVLQHEESIKSLNLKISNIDEKIKSISNSTNMRIMSREKEIQTLNSLQRLLIETQSADGLQRLISPENNLFSKNTIGTGKSPLTSLRTCFDIKKVQPNAEDGVYYINLGDEPSKAFQVYCDMTTEGGGWTLVSKQIGGKIFPKSKPSTLSVSKSNDTNLVTPIWFQEEFRNERNDKAFEFFATRSQQQWLKTMQLHKTSSSGDSRTVPVISQNILLKLKENSLLDVTESINFDNNQRKCGKLHSFVEIYTSRPSSDLMNEMNSKSHPIFGKVDYFAGKTSYVTNPSFCSGVGFASVSPIKEDSCTENYSSELCEKGDIVCQTNGLSTVFFSSNEISNSGVIPTSIGSGSLISSVFSSNCIFNCPNSLDSNDYFAEVAVYAVRPENCPSNEKGEECSGNGLCLDGICKCSYGYDGKLCATKICVRECSHGKCNSNGECECDDGYIGDVCEIPITCPLNTITSIDHSTLVPGQTRRGGRVYCTGNSYLDECVFQCDDGYQMSEIEGVVLRTWENRCEGAPSSLFSIPLNVCTQISSQKMIYIGEPDNTGSLNIKWYNGNSCDNNNLEILQRKLVCGGGCEQVNSQYLTVSCIGKTKISQVCKQQEGVYHNSSIGIWNGSKNESYFCQRSLCDEVQNIDFGTIKCSGFGEGDICEVSCHDGYVFENNPYLDRRHHQFLQMESKIKYNNQLLEEMKKTQQIHYTAVCVSGNWKSYVKSYSVEGIQALTCVRRDCQAPPKPEHGQYICQDTTYKAVCGIACDEGYERNSEYSMGIVCSSTGEWDGWAQDVCVLQK